MNGGRKAIYNPETLEVGERLQLKGPAKDYAHQYAARFRKDNPGRVFKKVTEGKKVLIERTA